MATTRSDSLAALGAFAKGSSPSAPSNLIARQAHLTSRRASGKHGLDVFRHTSGQDNVLADRLPRFYAPKSGPVVLPAWLPGVVHSVVATRSDACCGAERIQEDLLHR